MKNIFERLAEERKRLGFNKGQMAAAGNVANSTYTNYEDGVRSPDGEFFSAIAAAGADVLYILTGSRSAPVAPALSRDEAGMLDSYRHCSKEMQLAARTQLAAMAQPAQDVKKGKAA